MLNLPVKHSGVLLTLPLLTHSNYSKSELFSATRMSPASTLYLPTMTSTGVTYSSRETKYCDLCCIHTIPKCLTCSTTTEVKRYQYSALTFYGTWRSCLQLKPTTLVLPDFTQCINLLLKVAAPKLKRMSATAVAVFPFSTFRYVFTATTSYCNNQH